MWSKKNSLKFKKSETDQKFYIFQQSQLELNKIKRMMASEAEKKKKQELIDLIDSQIEETKACDQFSLDIFKWKSACKF